MAYGESNGHMNDDITMTPKGQTRNPNTRISQYLEKQLENVMAI